MMTAAEAIKLSESREEDAVQELINDQLNKAFELINKCCHDGLFRCELPVSTHSEVIKSLCNNGFFVWERNFVPTVYWGKDVDPARESAMRHKRELDRFFLREDDGHNVKGFWGKVLNLITR